MQNVLNVIVIFKDKPIGLKSTEYLNVESAKVREGGYYQIVNKGGSRIKIPLSNIEQIIENQVNEEVGEGVSSQ